MKPDEYDIMFGVEDRLWWYKGLRGILDVFWRRYVAANNARVLDVGCGTGATLVWLSQRALPTGIDFSQQAIHLCRKRNQCSTAAASATALPFQDESFDAVISCDVLCHRSIRDDHVPVNEMRRVLKPGGLLFLNLPAYQWLYSSHDVHVQTERRYNRRRAFRLLSETSMEPLDGTYWNTFLFPPILLVRLWRKMLPKPASDLADVPGDLANSMFGALLTAERNLLRAFPLPFGLSFFVVARKA